MSKHILYHSNNTLYPYLPQEDSYAFSGNVFVVADGITHDVNEKGLYPLPSDSFIVAKITCKSITKYLTNKNPTKATMRKAFELASKNTLKFNLDRELYINRENNAYSFGACTVAVGVIKDNTFFYGVLDDSFISIFSNDYVDHPILHSYVEESYKVLQNNFDLSKIENRKIFRKEMRNAKYTIGNKTVGYGLIDGRDGFQPYIQYGKIPIKPGDLICVYTDGFIPLMKDIELIKYLREKPLTKESYEIILATAKKLNVSKEMTGFFIQHT